MDNKKINKLALEYAIKEIGVKEEPKGSNSGKKVEEYLKSVNLGKGFSWCMAYVYWCFKQACVELGITNPLIKTGGVLAHWNQADKKYKVTNPQPGDIFIMDFGKGLGHTGLVLSVTDTHINTIEGNSNDEGSREGYEVCKRTRAKNTIKGYLRYV